jgi:ubiquitin-protein ligase
MSGSMRRLVSDYKKMLSSKDEYDPYFAASPLTNKAINEDGEIIEEPDFFHWNGVINGPPDTPYENGKFEIDIKFPSSYPKQPPVIKFITPIYHPNIFRGVICLNILKNDWTGCTSIDKVLLSLHLLLQHPNFKDPLNHEASALYMSDSIKYIETAKKMTSEN